jgi:hypothetical protein
LGPVIFSVTGPSLFWLNFCLLFHHHIRHPHHIEHITGSSIFIIIIIMIKQGMRSLLPFTAPVNGFPFSAPTPRNAKKRIVRLRLQTFHFCP